MYISDLNEFDIKGKEVANPKKYPKLYHLTDSNGFAYSIDNNALKAHRYSYVSTTWDPNMNDVGGRNHYHFKFILNGEKCLTTYKANHYKSYAEYTTGGKHWYDEKEIGIQTNAIEPLSDFVEGVIILVDIFSRSFVQWMFYANRDVESFLGGKLSSSASKGVEALYVFVKQWNKPIFVQKGEEVRSLNAEEKNFVNDCFRLSKRDITFDKALMALAKKYENKIQNHFYKQPLSSDSLRKEKLIPPAINKVNQLLANKDVSKIKSEKIKPLIDSLIQKFASQELAKEIIVKLETENLYDPLVPPSDWASLLKILARNEPKESILMDIDFMKKDLEQQREFYNPNSRFKKIHMASYAG